MGGGHLFASFSGRGRGFADPSIIPPMQPTETIDDLGANRSFPTISGAPIKPPSTIYSFSDGHCDIDLDSLRITEETSGQGSFDSVFGPVPTQLEIEKATSDLHKFMNRLAESESDTNWLQPVLYHYESRMVQSPGYRTVRDAFRMLETDPSVQNMVLSLSSDKAVWEAILKNEAVQNLHLSLSAAKEEKDQSFSEESEIENLLAKWILGITKSKIFDLIERFGLLVYEIFRPNEKEKPTSELNDLLEEKVRSSVLLSVVLLMIVVVTRNHGA